jgi:hypothetical protein
VTTLQILVSRISQSAKIRDPAQESKVARKPTGLSDGDLQLDCPARSEQVYLPTTVDVTKGCQLSPHLIYSYLVLLLTLPPKHDECGPQPYPLHCGPIYSTIWRQFPCWRRACDVCCSVRTIPPWGTCASHGANRYRDRPDVLRRAQQTQSLHLQLFHWTACCGRAPRDSDEDTFR